MKATTIRQGQTEIGIIEHGGREFAALGSSVHGRHVAGYTHRDKRGNISLKRWKGGTMLACRSEIAEQYRDWETGNKPVALVFSLTNGRFIVGYALSDNGSLFRGELVEADSLPDARQSAISEAEYWMQIDQDDRDRFDAEMMAEDDDDDSEDA